MLPACPRAHRAASSQDISRKVKSPPPPLGNRHEFDEPSDFCPRRTVVRGRSLQTHRAHQRKRGRGSGAMGGSWPWSRMVRWQRGRILHRRTRARCQPRDGPLLFPKTGGLILAAGPLPSTVQLTSSPSGRKGYHGRSPWLVVASPMLWEQFYRRCVFEDAALFLPSPRGGTCVDHVGEAGHDEPILVKSQDHERWVLIMRGNSRIPMRCAPRCR
jgi:hypothetical protein